MSQASIKTEIQVLTNSLSLDEYMHMSASLIRRLRIPVHRPLILIFGSRRLKLSVSPIARSKPTSRTRSWIDRVKVLTMPNRATTIDSASNHVFRSDRASLCFPTLRTDAIPYS